MKQYTFNVISYGFQIYNMKLITKLIESEAIKKIREITNNFTNLSYRIVITNIKEV